MNIYSEKIVEILREFIRAHHERGDSGLAQNYIPRLKQLAEDMESAAFQDLSNELQIARLRALGSEYFGRGEVFWRLAPKYIEIEYEYALEQAIKEYVDTLRLRE